MTISLVIHPADPRAVGLERYTVDLAAARAARAGMTCRSWPREFLAARRRAARSLSRQGPPHGSSISQVFLDALRPHLAEERYDIIHAILPVPMRRLPPACGSLGGGVVILGTRSMTAF